MNKIKAGRRVIKVSNLDKIYFPKPGYTKGDLIDYYLEVADVMLPHVKGRPLNMQRAPDGMNGKPFYQQEISDHFPDWIATKSVSKEGGRIKHALINNPATLVYLVDQGMVTPHVWLSTTNMIRQPDRMVFDLDPPEDDFSKVRFAANNLKDLLDELGVTAYLMSTGSKGVHVVVPLRPHRQFKTVRGLARRVSLIMTERYPDQLTLEHRKAKRRGRVFMDYLRNTYAQTTVAPYAVRLRPNAPVATPLEWDELNHPKLNAQSYNIKNMPRRLAGQPDPWRNMNRHRISFDALEQAVSTL